MQKMPKKYRKIHLKHFAAILALALAGTLALAACGVGDAAAPPGAQPESTPASAPAPTPEAESTPPAIEEDPMVEITMQDGGVIKLQLDTDAAPITVENFMTLVNDGFYDGLTFHRIMDGFMIQGGDPDGTGGGGPGHEIKGEFASNGWDNPLSHVRGTISMARGPSPDSAGSQFFITNADATFLDGDYAAFGTVVEGMDVVDAITAVDKTYDARGELSVPLAPVVIESIRAVEG